MFTFKKLGAVLVVLLLVVGVTPIFAFAADCGCCKCTCSCTCSCDGAKGKVQPAPAGTVTEESVKKETERVTDAHMWEDNRKQYNGYLLQLADAFSNSAKNSGFSVKTTHWKTDQCEVVEQQFTRNGWMLKLQYCFNSNGFFEDCHPVWLYHDDNLINSGKDWNGWSWSSSQTIYELLDMLSKI